MPTAVPPQDALRGAPQGMAAHETGSPRPWLAPLGLGAAAVAGCVALGVTNPGEGGAVLCPFRAMTGLDCPGCGMTRGLAGLLRGRIATAMDYNLAIVLAVPIIAYVYVTWLALGFGVRLPVLRLGARAYVVMGLIVGVFSVLRNMNVGPGRYLNSAPLP